MKKMICPVGSSGQPVAAEETVMAMTRLYDDYYTYVDKERQMYMRLTRREILEEFGRLGIRNFSSLKKAYREFEMFWDIIHDSIRIDTDDHRI